MTRHPAARRRPHTAPAADDDKFVHGVLESTAWARQHARTLVIAAVAIAALLIGFLVYRSYSTAKEAGAITALNDLRTTLASGNLQLALRDGEALLAQYGGTEAADEARLLLGELYLQANQPAQATQVLRPLAGDVDAPLGFNAAMLAGAAQEAAGQKEQAVQTFSRIGAEGRFLYQQIAGYEEAARIQTETGDVAAATATYQRILDLMDETAPERTFYEMRLAELATGGAPPNAAPPVVAADTAGTALGAPATIDGASGDTAAATGADTTP